MWNKKKKKKKKAKLQIDIGHVCRSFLLIGYSVLTDELTFLWMEFDRVF